MGLKTRPKSLPPFGDWSSESIPFIVMISHKEVVWSRIAAHLSGASFETPQEQLKASRGEVTCTSKHRKNS